MEEGGGGKGKMRKGRRGLKEGKRNQVPRVATNFGGH